VVEKLVIDHVGHRGDGVALGGLEAIYVPYALGGETVEVEEVHGHPDRRRLLAIDMPSPERITPFCPHFGVCGGCAIQHWQDDAYRAWKRDLVVETLQQAKLECEVAPLIDAHGTGPAASPCMRGSAPMTCSRSASPRRVRMMSFPSIAARSSIPVSTGRSMPPGRWPSR